MTEVDDVIDGRIEDLEKVVDADQDIDPLREIKWDMLNMIVKTDYPF